MKKIIRLMLMLVICFAFVACKEEKPVDDTPNDQDGTSLETRELSIIMPSGTPLIALGGVMDDKNSFEVVTDTALLQTALTSNTCDIVICPLTMAANLYMKGKTTYKLEAIITTNNTYLVSHNDLSVANLNGKDIVSFAQSNTPGFITKMFLEKNNITANVQYETNVLNSLNAFKNNNTEYAVIAEPQLTQLKKADANLKVINLSDGIATSPIPQACIFVKDEVKADKDVVAFLSKVKENIKNMNENPAEYATLLMEKNNNYFNSLTKEVIEACIPGCNLNYLVGYENKVSIDLFTSLCDTYCNNMFNGATLDEGFYNK